MRQIVTAAIAAATLVTVTVTPVKAMAVRPSEAAAVVLVDSRMYGMTGLLGRAMSFSTGVDTAMVKVAKAYPSIKTYPRSHWQKRAVYETAKANYRRDRMPIYLIGHSMGADAAADIALWLQKDGIPVAAIFAMDPTPLTKCIPSNVMTAIGWQRTYPGLGGGVIRRCGPSPFADSVQNYTVAGGKIIPVENYSVVGPHTYVDDAAAVHALIVKHVGDVRHMIEEMDRAPAVKKSEERVLLSAARRRSAAEKCQLSPRGRALWSRIKAAFPDARAISCTRPGARMPSGQHSHHATGDAIDWTTRNMAAGVAWSRRNAPGMTILYRSGHIHSDVGPWKGYASR